MESLKKFTTNTINWVYRKLMCSPVLQATKNINHLAIQNMSKTRQAVETVR